MMHPLSRIRRALLTGAVIGIGLVGAGLGWALWTLDSLDSAPDMTLLGTISGVIGGAALLTLIIIAILVGRAARRGRGALSDLALTLNTNPASRPPTDPAGDPEVRTIIAALETLHAGLSEQRAKMSEERDALKQAQTEATRFDSLEAHLHSTLERDPLLTHYVAHLRELLELDLVLIGLVTARGLEVRYAAAANDAPDVGGWLSLEQGLAADAYRGRQPIRRLEPPFDHQLPQSQSLAFQGAWPLGSGEPSAVLCAQHHEPLAPALLVQLDRLAIQLGLALENTQRYTQMRERANNLSAINELARLMSASLDIKQIIDTALQHIRQLVPYDQASVVLFENERNQFAVIAAADSFKGQIAAGQTIDAPDSPLRSAFEAGQPVAIGDIADPALIEALPPLDPASKSLLIIPLTTADVRLGTLNLAARSSAAFDDSHITMLSGLGHFLTSALVNGRLYQQRTAAMRELEATQAHLLLVEKLRALGELAGGVTHDFNNLLAGILGNVQLLMLDIHDQEQLTTLRLIEKAAKDGAETVKRIQGFARNDGDQPDAPVDLTALVQDAMDLTRLRWRNAAQEQGIHIEVQREVHPVPIIRGHAPELREVLTNLIINAVDAMPQGGILRVATGQRGAEVFVSVADTGMGMSEEVRNRIFDPFFSTKGAKGNGLGLAVSAAIVQRHGGRIDVQSKVGQGTNFAIWLPILEVDLDEVAAHDDEVPAANGRILLVEDENLVRVALSRMLSAWGHRVVACETGREAMSAFRSGAFDAIICDLGLPDMQGWDVLRHIREQDRQVHTMLLTGWARQIDPAEARMRGVDVLVAKPFDQLTLRRTVGQLLEGSLDMTPRLIS